MWRKISEYEYMYKNCVVNRLSNGNYVAEVSVNDCKFPIRIVGSTQANFKKIFNEVVADNGGLK